MLSRKMLNLSYFLLAASFFASICAKKLSLGSLEFNPSPETPTSGGILSFSGSRVLSTCGISKVSCSRRKLSKNQCLRFRCCWNEELSSCTRPTFNIIKLQTTCGEGLGDPPKCGPITCPALELPANGATLTCDHPTHGPFVYGSLCNHICDVGHTPSTAADVTCTGDGSTMDGHWEPAQPDCDITQCASPAAVTGSEYDCVGGINYGETCDVICAAGYTGAFTMNCDQHTTNAPTSSWDDTTPCTITSCASPSPSLGSVFGCTGDVTYGGTCDLVCRAGFTGAKTMNCNQHTYNAAISTWDDDSACTLTSCASPSPALGSVFGCTGDVNYGETCQLVCRNGYTGARTMNCNVHEYNAAISTWDNDAPCTITSCASPSAVTGSTFSCTGDVNYGDTCDLTCDAGYIGAKTLNCNQHTSNAATSTWDDDSACTITSCASPSDVTGSTFSCSGDVNYGGTCELTCDTGYEGARTLNCNQHTAGAATSTWDDDSACVLMACPSPTNVAGSTYDCTGDVMPGGTCDLICATGYIGARTMNCAAGAWDDASPCTITSCAPPLAVTGSTFGCTEDIEFGGTCEVTCEAGYTGAMTMTCNVHSEGDAVSYWDDDTGCRLTMCASPSDATGSTFSCSGNVMYGGTCDLTCGRGYTGSRTLNCNQHTAGAATSTWDDDSLCPVAQCAPPPAATGSTFSCTSNVDFGGTCELTCDSDLLSGARTLNCNQHTAGDALATYDDVTPCILTACETLSDIDLMFVNDESGSVSYYDPQGYYKTKLFMVDLATQLKEFIDSGTVHVGVVTFGTSPRVQVPLAQRNFEDLKTDIMGIAYADTYTYAGEAIEMAHDKLNTDGRAGVKKFIVIITDGDSSDDVAAPSDAARADGIIVIAVGVEGYEISQLQALAGGDTDLVHTVNEFDDLFDVSISISSSLCHKTPEECVAMRSPPSAYFAYKGYIYREVTTLKKRGDALNWCRSDGGTLAYHNFGTIEDRQAIHEGIGADGRNSRWINLKLVDGVWQTYEGTPWAVEDLHWEPNEPHDGDEAGMVNTYIGSDPKQYQSIGVGLSWTAKKYAICEYTC